MTPRSIVSVDNGNGHGFNWSGFWARFGVVIVGLMLGVSVYGQLQLRGEIRNRREAFCLSENRANLGQRGLWTEVILRSQANPDRAYVVVQGKRYNVTFIKDMDAQDLEGFRKFIETTFPMSKCGPNGAITPSPTGSP